MATFTLQDVYNIAYWIVKQPENSSAYSTTLLKTFINKAQNDICFGNLTNLQTGEKLPKMSLPFLNDSAFYTTVAKTTVSTIPAIWDSILYAATTWFASSGYLYVKGNILHYTWITATSFIGISITGKTSIKFAFERGTPVIQAYLLPTDFSQAVEMNYNKNQRLVSLDQRDIINETWTSYFLQRFFRNDFAADITNTEYYYSIIDATYFIFIGPNVSGRMLRLDYQTKPIQLVNPTDVLTIPDEYSLNTIPYLAIAEMMFNRWESDEGMKLQNFWYNNAYNMYKYYQSQKTELMFNQRVRTQKDFMYPNI